MGMGSKERRLVVIFDDTSPGAKQFATAVMDLAEETYGGSAQIYVDFSVPKDGRWKSIRPAPTIDVDQLLAIGEGNSDS